MTKENVRKYRIEEMEKGKRESLQEKEKARNFKGEKARGERKVHRRGRERW